MLFLAFASTFTSTYAPSDPSCTISDCYFSGCSAAHYGGALAYTVTTGIIHCRFSSFYNCQVDTYGGAIYTKCYAAYLAHTCFDTCYMRQSVSGKNGNSALLDCQFASQNNYSFIVRCSPITNVGGPTSFAQHNGDQYSTNTNASNNMAYMYPCYLFRNAASSASSYCIYSDISGNFYGMALFCLNNAGTHLASYCNFLNITVSWGAISGSSGSYTCTNCAFFDNNINSHVISSTATFVSCISDIGFAAGATEDCTITAAYLTVPMSQLHSDVCLKMTAPFTPGCKSILQIPLGFLVFINA